MNIVPLKTNKDYENALKRMELLFDAPAGTPESDEADILALVIDDYEGKHFSIEAPDPIEAPLFLLSCLNLGHGEAA